jgi:GTPase SAR1 family protein
LIEQIFEFFFSGIFVSNLSSTLGVDFQVKTIRVDGRNIALQLWDTAGEITLKTKLT